MLNRVLTLAALSVAASTPIFAQTATTTPVGFTKATAPVGYSGNASTLILSETFTGQVSANTATTVTFNGAGLNLGAGLVAGRQYYLEVVSGALEGERVDVDEAATVTAANGSVILDVSAAHNTSSLVPASLVGLSCAIREHLTLSRLQGMFSPALVGNNNATLADRVLIYEGGWVQYNLRGDGASWRKPADVTDYRSKIITPGSSFLLQFVGSSKELTQVGSVRTNAFRLNLVSGYQSFAPPYPVDLSPTQMAAFVDVADPAGIRWVGNNNAALADQILPYDGGFVQYNLRTDGTTWRKPADVTNYAGSPIVKYNGATLVKRTNSDPTYLVLRPFSL